MAVILGGPGIYLGGATPVLPGLILDDYPNAEVAYSLRKLRTAYTGNTIRVRRSNDNAEQDIGFIDNDLDTASLLSFVGANNGFIATWYDQSGNANNCTNITASRQAQIVSSGSLIIDPNTSKISSLWTLDAYFLASNILTTQEMYHYMVFNRINSADTNAGLVNANSTSATMLRWTAIPDIRTYLNTVVIHAVDSSTGANLITTLRDSASNVKMYKNTSALTSGVSSAINNTLNAWGQANGSYSSGYQSELIHWNLDQEANRAAIETNVNNYWTIY